MRKYKEITVTENVLSEISCDVCGTTYGEQDNFEIQEMHHIDFYGGYESVFGDGSHIKIDLCQHCLKSMLEKQGVNLDRCTN